MTGNGAALSSSTRRWVIVVKAACRTGSSPSSWHPAWAPLSAESCGQTQQGQTGSHKAAGSTSVIATTSPMLHQPLVRKGQLRALRKGQITEIVSCQEEKPHPKRKATHSQSNLYNRSTICRKNAPLKDYCLVRIFELYYSVIHYKLLLLFLGPFSLSR